MRRFLFAGVFALCGAALFAETFQYRYFPGEKYRILSTVREDVFINDRPSHKAEILNRITVEVGEVKDGAGFLSCTFQTSEESRSAAGLFSWGQTYDSKFWQDSSGVCTIDDAYFMPIVRNVPLFPKKDLFPGETWTSRGEEVHDFRASFGLKEAVRFPIDVAYRYSGKETKDGRDYEVVLLSYNVFHRPRFKNRPDRGALFPVRISGESRQKLYWDTVRGRAYAYEEEFDFIFDLSDGKSIEYRGSAEAKVVESSLMEKDLVAKDIKKDLQDLAVKDTHVKIDSLGVTLTLENIQFPPDSADLVPEEKVKLDRIAEILKKYPDRDILITGHTALAGTEGGRQKLSEDRAASVGTYLLEKGVRTRDRMSFRGLGATVPVADNADDAGRQKNRRVEITILEN